MTDVLIAEVAFGRNEIAFSVFKRQISRYGIGKIDLLESGIYQVGKGKFLLY